MKLKAIIINIISNRFVKFLMVGVVNTAFSYCVFAFFIFIGFHYSVATLIAYFIGVLFNFKTIGVLVFKNNSNTLLIRFVVVYVVVYFINVLMQKGCHLLGANKYVAGALVALPAAVISYFLNKKYVFERSTKS